MPNAFDPSLPSYEEAGTNQSQGTQGGNAFDPTLPSYTSSYLNQDLQNADIPQPSDVSNARQELGLHEDMGLCLSFAQDMAGVQHTDATAINNFNDYASKGQAYSGFQGIQPGDFAYFENGGAGHVGVVSGFDSSGQPTFISATDNGVQEMGINDWQNYAGQTYVGYVNPYQ